MNPSLFDKHFTIDKRTSDNRRDLISQIVERTTEKDKAKLARVLAIAANTLKWSTTDLHALLKKADDPTIRSYTAFVWWNAKVSQKRAKSGGDQALSA